MMIESIALMSVLDFVIIGLVVYGGLHYRAEARVRNPSSDKTIALGQMQILAGLSVVALFHLVDLFTMHVLPYFVGHDAAMAIMRSLHLDQRWLVSLVAVGLIAYGLRLESREVSRLIARLRESETNLSARLAEREQLVASEQIFREALEASTIGIAAYDADDRLAAWNNAYLELQSLTPATARQHPTFEEVERAGPQSGGRIETQTESTASGSASVIEQRSNSRWLRRRRARTERGTLLDTLSDISAEVASRDALEAREEQLQTILDVTPIPIFIADWATSKFIYGNRAAADAFGLTEEQFVDTPGSSLYANPEDRGKFLETLEKNGVVSDYRVELKRADGAPLHVAITACQFEFRNRRCLLLAYTDVSAQLAAQAALHETEARYHGVFDFSPVPMYLHDGERILESNPAAANLYGYDSVEEMRGLEIIGLVHPDDRAQYRERLADMRQNPRPLDFVEDRRVRKDGKYVIVEQAGTPLEVGGETLILAVNRDLTAHREAEVVLRQSQKMEAVGQLTGGIAHDFNNLLSIILGNIGLLRHSAELGQEIDGYASAVETAVQRGANLTGRLLSFARRQPLSPEVIDLNGLVAQNTELLERTLGETIILRTVRSAGLWTVCADRSQLETALLNLVLNARDAMPDGGKLTIEIANTDIDEQYARSATDVTAGRYVVLAVSDTGVGMEADVMERVFEPFFTTKPTDKGTGLGLSMVFGFVKQSGGHVNVYSEPGKGTTFRLYLPKAEDTETTRVQALREPHAALLEGLNVLVVEDDDSLRGIIVAMLEQMSVTVSQARDGEAAFAVSDELETLDLLLTDIVLPGEWNGRELAEALGGQRPSVKVLFMSGYTENAILHNGQLKEGMKLLQKPFTQRQLGNALRTVLGVYS